MRIVRFSAGDAPQYGVLEEGSSRIVALKGDPLFQEVEPSGQILELDEVRLLSPVIPRSKVVGVANAGAAEGAVGAHGEDFPHVFLKPNTSVIGPGDPIILPSWSEKVVAEAEIGIVIKTLAKDVPLDKVDDVILGYVCANDATAGDALGQGPWSRGKGFDTSTPLGPWILVDPDFDPDNIDISISVNGELYDQGTNARMRLRAKEVVSRVSHMFTLLPGDVIVTGTALQAPVLQSGDEVAITIGGIGTLSNPVHRL